MRLLTVTDLSVKLSLKQSEVPVLNGISFGLSQGERLGIVGESGAGKSITGLSLINMLSSPGYIDSGSVIFADQDMTKMKESQLQKIRGNNIAIIFQDPMETLNPVLTIGQQMIETIMAHRLFGREESRRLAISKLEKVYISSPEKRLDQYPHELSGGMQQRIIIAIALLLDPQLIIADEPTTALDVTIQAEIMDLLFELCSANKVGLILITHDLNVVSQMTDRTVVMYAGRIVEAGATNEIVNNPKHPYTQGLFKSLPQNATPGRKLYQIPGNMPPLTNIPTGCPFHPRCPIAAEICVTHSPANKQTSGVEVACHKVEMQHKRDSDLKVTQ